MNRIFVILLKVAIQSVFFIKYRILSLSGRFTLVEHDFGFINRKQMIIENFKNIERVKLPNSVRMVKTIAKSYV